MNLLLSILFAICLCATASAQTIKTLGYNASNGVVVYTNTNTLVFKSLSVSNYESYNPLRFVTTDESLNAGYFGDIGKGQWGVVFNFGSESQWGVPILMEEGQNIVNRPTASNTITFIQPLAWSETNFAATTRANLGFSTNLNTLWTATNIYIATDALGFSLDPDEGGTKINAAGGLWDTANGEYSLRFEDGDPFFGTSVNKALWRTNLGLPLAALTNTSNVTAMRALSGSTNTNHPYSGSISVTGTNNTNTLVFSNGILQSVQ